MEFGQFGRAVRGDVGVGDTWIATNHDRDEIGWREMGSDGKRRERESKVIELNSNVKARERRQKREGKIPSGTANDDD
jgi:hypothetical protein